MKNEAVHSPIITGAIIIAIKNGGHSSFSFYESRRYNSQNQARAHPQKCGCHTKFQKKTTQAELKNSASLKKPLQKINGPPIESWGSEVFQINFGKAVKMISINGPENPSIAEQNSTTAQLKHGSCLRCPCFHPL